VPALPAHELHGQGIGVVVRVGLLLPAVDVQVLAEVPLLVQQAHADQGNAQVGRALEVVAGQDAQAAGVDRQALVDAELRAEVGDHRMRLLRPDLVEPRRRPEIRAELIGDLPQLVEETLVLGQGLELLLRDQAQQLDRVVATFRPKAAVDPLEQGHALRIPGPIQVACNGLKVL